MVVIPDAMTVTAPTSARASPTTGGALARGPELLGPHAQVQGLQLRLQVKPHVQLTGVVVVAVVVEWGVGEHGAGLRQTHEAVDLAYQYVECI